MADLTITSTMQEYRCECGRFHFAANAEGIVRVSCRYCAKVEAERRGYRVVVFHWFDIISGKQVGTRVFRDATDLPEIMERKGGEIKCQ